MILSRAVLGAAALAALFFAVAARAQTEERYAAILVDARTGEVLHDRFADRLRHPASLTKLMTLYLTFASLRAGEIGLGDGLRVSAHAAAQAPVDIGLQEGETIRVLDALKALVVRSANDAAVVLAERLAPDEETFAARMTEAAAAIGMTRTRFKNASGLPNADQVTTARDVALLASALRDDFPEYYPLFEVRHMDWGGRTYFSHNNILDLVDGADGLKTGYVDASGYNLAASAVRGDDRLIAIVMGGSSGSLRDGHAALLLERGFEELAERRARGEMIVVAERDDAEARARRLRIILDGLEDHDQTPPTADASSGAAIESAPLEPVAGPETTPPAPSSPASSGPAPLATAETASAARPTAAPPSTSASSFAEAAGAWRVQVGAFQDQTRAEDRLEALTPVAVGPDAGLALIRMVTPAADVSPPLYRAQLAGFADRSGASAACDRIKASGAACFVVGP